MLDALRRPVAIGPLVVLTAVIATGAALYCLAYTALAGRPETPQQSFTWALVNIAPWIPALELAKRARGAVSVAGALAFGFAASLGLGLLFDPAAQVGFEAWRRLPTICAATVLALALKWNQARVCRSVDPMPLLPRQIDWVQAAGNYIELRAGNRTIVHRASISAAERDLAEHGFVRIHRSTLVRRDRIARVRPADVVLMDGTHLKVGKRFRSQLSA